jgi:hypothetical protein
MEYFRRLQRSHGQKGFHISDVRHACDKASEGGDYWVKRMMKAGLVVKRGRDEYEIAKVGSLDPEWLNPPMGQVGMKISSAGGEQKMKAQPNRQVVGNIGMYFAAYQLSLRGWNVMPTSRNARGIDLLAYDSDADHYLGIQIKALSGIGAVPLGKSLDNLLGEWWIVVSAVATTPECYVLTPAEVRTLAVRDKNGDQAYWLPRKQYATDEFHEAWDRIGRGDLASGPE